MNLEIITPETTLFNAEVTLVQLPGKTGSFEIMHNHAPMIATLKKGKIKIIEPNKNIRFLEINGGTLQVLNNNILILAD